MCLDEMVPLEDHMEEVVRILVDKDDLINYQLIISYALLTRILRYQRTCDC